MDELAEKAKLSPDSSYQVAVLSGKQLFKYSNNETQIERGSPNLLIDTIGNILAIPQKLIFVNSQYHSNYVSPETEEILRQYLEDNKLQHVKVRINQWNPIGEIERHFTNPRFSFLVRLVMCPLTIYMSIFEPERLFGCDHYNPFTDTLHIVSNDPVIALHEAGHAKDSSSRSYPFLYALLAMFAFGALHHEAVASLDSIAYMKAKQFTKLVPHACNTLAPVYATYCAASLLTVVDIAMTVLLFTGVGVLAKDPLVRGVKWLQKPLVKISTPVLRFLFAMPSRLKIIFIGMGHAVGQVAARCLHEENTHPVISV